MNCDEASRYSFSLYNRHVQFLDNINGDNRSSALQSILNAAMDNDEKQRWKLAIDRVIQYGMYSAIFLLLSYLLVFPLNIASIGFGAFILTYGMVGGIRFALSRTNGN